MEEIRVRGRPAPITWDYDEDADVLYVSIGEPRPATGVDIGEGTIVRYDEKSKEVVGLTLIGLRQRVVREIAEAGQDSVP